MSKSVDHRALPTVLFVTDPLCSWCWGTLPEVLTCREKLRDEVNFELMMGGLQIGRADGLLGYDIKRLTRLWAEVRETTGQRFSGIIPNDFVYHSELSCRAVEVARDLNDSQAPFTFFAKLQAAFYIEGQDINSVKVLAPLLGLSETETTARLAETEIKTRTRDKFELVKSLSANALPNFLIDTGDGFKLLCGGYVTEAFLTPDIRQRIEQARD